MTDIEKKALALVRDVADGYEDVSIHHVHNAKTLRSALCRAIEQHEAFKREVSDAVEAAKRVYGGHREAFDQLDRFIIAKPDPLVEAIADYKRTKGTGEYATNKDMAAALRAALAARGLEIREKQP